MKVELGFGIKSWYIYHLSSIRAIVPTPRVMHVGVTGHMTENAEKGRQDRNVSHTITRD